jgi:hypothetical protein
MLPANRYSGVEGFVLYKPLIILIYSLLLIIRDNLLDELTLLQSTHKV